MNGLQEWTVQCPSCGTDNELLIEPSAAEQEYVEDCRVCCRPMRVRVRVDVAGVVTAVEVAAEND